VLGRRREYRAHSRHGLSGVIGSVWAHLAAGGEKLIDRDQGLSPGASPTFEGPVHRVLGEPLRPLQRNGVAGYGLGEAYEQCGLWGPRGTCPRQSFGTLRVAKVDRRLRIDHALETSMDDDDESKSNVDPDTGEVLPEPPRRGRRPKRGPEEEAAAARVRAERATFRRQEIAAIRAISPTCETADDPTRSVVS
jgi:hypothetical protein